MHRTHFVMQNILCTLLQTVFTVQVSCTVVSYDSFMHAFGDISTKCFTRSDLLITYWLI